MIRAAPVSCLGPRVLSFELGPCCRELEDLESKKKVVERNFLILAVFSPSLDFCLLLFLRVRHCCILHFYPFLLGLGEIQMKWRHFGCLIVDFWKISIIYMENWW